MSFCVASCFTCSRRASSASATSASSPTEAALLSCRYASLLCMQFHRKPNRNPRPHQPPCGAVPSALDPWPSWNDSPRRNSNSVLHHSWPQLHELTRSHTALATLPSVRRSVSPFHPDIFFLSLPRSTSVIDSSFHSAPPPSPPALTTPANFYPPPSPHSICISPAPAAPAASF